MKLSGRVALITGASRGIGEALARELAREGVHLVLGARNREKVEALARELREKYGIRALGRRLDVTDRTSIRDFVGAALEEMDSLDILVNNAGVGFEGPIETVEQEDYDLVMKTNLDGAFWMTREVVPVMKQQGQGMIVNISSLAGYVGLPRWSLYHMSKFGLRGFTESLRLELAPFGIHVMGVYPGPVKTGFFQHAVVKEKRTLEARGGRYLSPEKMARAIVRGMKGRKRDVFGTFSWWLIAALASRYPALADWAILRFGP